MKLNIGIYLIFNNLKSKILYEIEFLIIRNCSKNLFSFLFVCIGVLLFY